MSEPTGVFTYPYARPAVTVDLVIVTIETKPRVLLIQRDRDPFAGAWALPGGFVDANEPLETAAQRELREETNLEVDSLTQLAASGDPGRDPRGWTVSIAFVARITAEAAIAQAGDDARAVGWFTLQNLPDLAFDHAKILTHARAYMKRTRRKA